MVSMTRKTLAMAMMIGASAFSLQGCVTAGAEYQANVFDASQVNTQQEAKTVKILTVSPAKVKVSNEKNQRRAQLVGALLGAAAGGAAGANRHTNTGLAGAAAGGAVGIAAGSLVASEVLVDGVLLGYSLDGKIFTSTQVGKPCEFVIGEIALMVSMVTNETRIQPNGTCPVPGKG